MKMCKLAFAPLERQQQQQPAAQRRRTRLIISDAEKQSWWHARPQYDTDEFSVGTAALLEFLRSNPSALFQNMKSTTTTSNHTRASIEVTVTTLNNTEKQLDADGNDGNHHNDRVKDTAATATAFTTTDYEFCLCLGADAFCDLVQGKWRESQRVLDLASGFTIVPRPHAAAVATTTFRPSHSDNGPGADADAAQHEDSNLKACLAQVPTATLLTNLPLSSTMSSTTNQVVSSSRVRACTRLEELKDDFLVVPAVRDYMIQHELYGFSP